MINYKIFQKPKIWFVCHMQLLQAFSNLLKGFFEKFVHQGSVKTNVGLVILFSILKIKITHSHS